MSTTGTLDPVSNFGVGILIGGPYTSSSTTFTLSYGDGFWFPTPATDGDFYLALWNPSSFNSAWEAAHSGNIEFVRVSARATDTLTVSRGQLGTTPLVPEAGWILHLGVTANTITEIHNSIPASVKRYGAVGDGVANDTAAIQAAIDAAYSDGGGVVFFPRGVYIHTGLSAKAGVTLRGSGRGVTILKNSSTSANSITGSGSPDNFDLGHLTLTASTTTSGWAFTSTASTNRELSIHDVEVNNHLKGFTFTDGLNIQIARCRLNGTGKTASGGIGIQIGSAVLGGNGIDISSSYVNTYQTGIIVHAQACLLSRVVAENCTTGVQTNNGSTEFHIPWVSVSNTVDLDVVGNGILALGYGSDNWVINWGSASAKNRSIVLPSRMDFTSGSVNRGVRFGRTMIYNEGAYNVLSMGKTDLVKFRDSIDADGTEDTTSWYRDAAGTVRTPSHIMIDGKVIARSTGTSPVSPISNACFVIQGGGVDERKLVLQAAASPTYAMAEYRKNDDSVLSKINSSDGSFEVTGGLKVSKMLQFGAATSVTIATGTFAYASTNTRIDTEGAAAIDDLDSITGGVDGDFIILRTVSSARDVVVKHLTGNIFLFGGRDITLALSTDCLVLIYAAGSWVQQQNGSIDPVSGDILASGGFRQAIDGWYRDDAAASLTAVVMSRLAGTGDNAFIPPRAGSITGICVQSNAARTAGTLTVEVYKGGSATGLTAVLDGTNTTFKATTQAKDLDTFVAGDKLDIRITTDAGWLPVTADIRASMEIET